MLIALPDGWGADLVADALADHVVRLPEELCRSLTWDQGKEMAAHARFTIATGLPVYFCDPRRPWQRGTRTPTGCCASTSLNAPASPPFSQTDLDAVTGELNGRSRQALDWMTPSQALDQALQ
jgi:IS30 family transposase